MKISRTRFFTISAIVLSIVAGFVFLAFASMGKPESLGTSQIVDGKQVIDLTATFSGYSPAIIEARANTDTVLKVSTKNAFGCANALTIPQLDVYHNLKPSDITEIQIGSQEPGTTIEGLCSMGMHRFVMKFS